MLRSPLADRLVPVAEPAADSAADRLAPATEAALLQLGHRALERIAGGDRPEQAFGEIARGIGGTLAPVTCAIATVEGETPKAKLVAAPDLSPVRWDTLAAGIDAILKSETPRAPAVPAMAEVDALAGAALSTLLWCRPVRGGCGALIGAIALLGLPKGGPSPQMRAAIERVATVVQIAIERLRHMDRLKLAEDRFAALTANIPGVVYQRKVTPDGEIRYTYISEGARDLFGVSPQEILTDPKALFSCHGPSYRKDFRDRLLEASKTLSMWDVEAEIISRDGQRKWTHATARPTRLPDGSVQWDGIILDATRIANREQILLREKEAAESANRGMSEFISSMSHELRTPLNAIIGFSELMMNETAGPLGNERYVSYCSDILASGRHLLNIVNDVLDISKIESGKLALNEEPVDLEPIAWSVVQLVQGRADANKVALNVALADGLPYLLADERLVKQTLLNLLSNAVKFTKEAGRVDLSVRVVEDAVEIAVQDTGIGMAPADIPRAMERFSQIDNSLSRRHEGTGLGLYLVKLFMELHQATVTLTSEPGIGTTATLRFPARRSVQR